VVNTTRQSGLSAYTIQGASVYFSLAEKAGMAGREGADLIEIVENSVDKTGKT
jgi:hypothetical protein